jgi:hypothetical protein
MPKQVSWVFMGIIGVMVVVIGVEGSLGKMLGCLLTPSAIVIN